MRIVGCAPPPRRTDVEPPRRPARGTRCSAAPSPRARAPRTGRCTPRRSASRSSGAGPSGRRSGTCILTRCSAPRCAPSRPRLHDCPSISLELPRCRAISPDLARPRPTSPDLAKVRDLLALSIALNATMIMPPLVCTCDRYWGFLENCRMPTGPEDMRLPFRCAQVLPRSTSHDLTRPRPSDLLSSLDLASPRSTSSSPRRTRSSRLSGGTTWACASARQPVEHCPLPCLRTPPHAPRRAAPRAQAAPTRTPERRLSSVDARSGLRPPRLRPPQG